MIIVVVYLIDYLSKAIRERFIYGDRVLQGHDRPMEKVAEKFNR
jgi:hypothetical protein